MTPHDRAYKQLFQNKTLLQLLFTPEMLGEEWAELLDFNYAQLIPNEQIDQSLVLRQNDQIWRIKRQDSAGDLYVLLLLEFQSSVEPKMALRISTYVTLLYEQLLKRKEVQLHDGLPIVLPVVLYTGIQPWSAHQELSALLQPVPTRLLSYQPQQRYLLIDQRLWVKNKTLPKNNLTALLFLLEHTTDVTQAQQLLRDLDQQSVQFREIRLALLSWLRYVYFPRVTPEFTPQPNFSFPEVHDMIELDPRRWGYKERMEGREEGREEGLKQAQLTILLRLLENKFGPLSTDWQQRIQTASEDQREQWTIQLLHAQSLDDLLH